MLNTTLDLSGPSTDQEPGLHLIYYVYKYVLEMVFSIRPKKKDYLWEPRIASIMSLKIYMILDRWNIALINKFINLWKSSQFYFFWDQNLRNGPTN